MKAIILLLVTVAAGVFLWFQLKPSLQPRTKVPPAEDFALRFCRDWLPVVEEVIRLENKDSRVSTFRDRIVARMPIHDRAVAMPIREFAVHCLFPERMDADAAYILIAVQFTRTNAPMGVVVCRGGKCYATTMGLDGAVNVPLGIPCFYVGH